MKKYIFLSIIFSLIFASCSDEIINNEEDGNNFDGKVYINLCTDIPSQRTRSVDFTDNAALNLGKLWLASFNATNGNLLTKRVVDLNNKNIISGTDLEKIAYLNLPTGNNSIFIVGVCNFEDIKTSNGGLLENSLNSVTSWQGFQNLVIDTESAYEGVHGTLSPLLFGFLHEKGRSNILVNQFGNNIYGLNLTSVPTIYSPYNTSNLYLHLRRMVSQINVNINTANGITISNLQYKRMNMPKSQYLAERRTDNQRFTLQYSPNSSDVDPTNLYYSDDDWISAQGNLSFSFQHFENKHWARNNINSYQDRGKKNDDGSFKALANSKDDFNNYASYYILNMHIVDSNKGISADVEYTIHEGYTSNPDGNSTSNQNYLVNDFQCARNTDYTYTIQVNGVNDIITNVVSSNGAHNDDQKGNVWQLISPVNPDNYQLIPIGGGNYQTFLTFDTDPVNCDDNGAGSGICFRLIGFDENDTPVDIFYNFPDEALPLYAPLWMNTQAYTIQYSNQVNIDEVNIPDVLLEAFTIDGKNLKEFIKSNPTAGTYTLSVNSFNAGNARPGTPPTGLGNTTGPGLKIRALYIANRKDLLDGKIDGKDGCSIYHKMYAAEQNRTDR